MAMYCMLMPQYYLEKVFHGYIVAHQPKQLSKASNIFKGNKQKIAMY
jgi:hypothetical protein